MKILLIPAIALIASPVSAEPASPKELHATVEALVGFGTRHTLSTTTDPKRGIGAARTWGQRRFEQISKACGGCLTVEQVADTFTGPRAPNGVIVADVLAIQKGTEEPGRVIMVAGHIDSRVTDVMNITADAPGANDDGSGSALVLEAARILSKTKHRATIVYALLSGEEQGLWGGQLLARTAKDRGWQVSAMLNNDIVGNTHGTAGTHIDDKVRVFSEGIRSSEDAEANKLRRGIGGEDDGPSRALAKYVDGLAIRTKGLEVLAIRRPDRFQRGGDHSPSLDLGYPAIRFTEATENYDREHQDLRTEGGKTYGDTIDAMDFPYLARVTDLNIAAITALANAPAAPADTTIAGALSNDTTVRWSAVPGANAYRIYWRRADGPDWTDHKDVKDATELLLKDVNIDDNFFGVSSIAADGAESLISFAAGQPRKN